VKVLIVLAVINQTALLAQRIARPANSAPVANQIDVRFVVALPWNHLTHQAVRFFVRTSIRNQSEPPSDSKDVSVYGKDWSIASEQQGARDGLRSDAFQAAEKLFGFFEWRGSQERQIERPAALINFIKQLFDPARLLSGKSAGSYRGFDRGNARSPGRFPRRKPLLQVLERAIAVNVGCRLREYRPNEHIKRIKPALRLRRAVDRFKILNDVRDRFWNMRNIVRGFALHCELSITANLSAQRRPGRFVVRVCSLFCNLCFSDRSLTLS